MRFHWQNLNEKSHGRTGSALRDGRAWLDFKKCGFRVQWNLFKRTTLGVQLSLADYEDDAIGGHIGIGFAAVYWGFKNLALERFLERVTSREDKPRELDQCKICLRMIDKHGNVSDHLFAPRTYWSSNGRTIGIRWFEGSLWIDLWNDPMEYRSKDPKWWHMSWNPADSILGRKQHTERVLETKRAIVAMPERGYWAQVEMKEERWQRPLAPWATTIVRAHITMEPGEAIPFPGKGENAWDCGEDATSAFTCVASSVTEGICALTESVMKSRERHGGLNWEPEKVRSK